MSRIFYYKALQMGEASKVAPVDKFSAVIMVVLALRGKITLKTIAGALLITAETARRHRRLSLGESVSIPFGPFSFFSELR